VRVMASAIVHVLEKRRTGNWNLRLNGMAACPKLKTRVLTTYLPEKKRTKERLWL